MLRAYFHIARNTFRENLRQPIYLLILTLGLALIGTAPAFTLFVFRHQEKLVTDTAMATMLSFGWVLAVLIASHSITREIRGGTATLVLSKPVNRLVFVLGKITGIISGLTLFCLIIGTASLISVGIATDQFQFNMHAFSLFFLIIVISFAAGGVVNYVKRSSFSMATVLCLTVLFPIGMVVISRILPAGEGGVYRWEMIPALLLIMFAVWMLGILATTFSTRLDWVPNLLICGVIFICGLMSDYFLGRLADKSLAADALYAIIPNWQLFWMADALAAGKSVPVVYVLWAAAYVLLFGGLFTILAYGLFAHREVGEQDNV